MKKFKWFGRNKQKVIETSLQSTEFELERYESELKSFYIDPNIVFDWSEFYNLQFVVDGQHQYNYASAEINTFFLEASYNLFEYVKEISLEIRRLRSIVRNIKTQLKEIRFIINKRHTYRNIFHFLFKNLDDEPRIGYSFLPIREINLNKLIKNEKTKNTKGFRRGYIV
jgi:hypothetical protein